MHSNRLALAASASVFIGIQAALAGEPVVAPVVEVTPVEVAPVSVSTWAGGYVGGSLGYSFSGDDEIGLELLSDGSTVGRANDLGEADIKGVTGGLHAGYRWQRNKWVFGPELGIEGGSVDGSDAVSAFGSEGTLESDVKYVATLVMKTGYEVSPGTLVYGTAGIAHGKFDYTGTLNDDSQTVEYSNTGYALGLGVERRMSDRMSIFAEYQYRDFGEKTVEFDIGDDTAVATRPTPTHSNVKVGLNFRF
ncbi:outer membrane protein [Paracoccus beibuensis]|uniref:outer membrane protein n=1 Tax=Paracoccus beibuensis TaxID=547602 RepID=UPI002240D01F|nr:outer membrane beta-barrel protein [Paracoccus beibuensis]